MRRVSFANLSARLWSEESAERKWTAGLRGPDDSRPSNISHRSRKNTNWNCVTASWLEFQALQISIQIGTPTFNETLMTRGGWVGDSRQRISLRRSLRHEQTSPWRRWRQAWLTQTGARVDVAGCGEILAFETCCGHVVVCEPRNHLDDRTL